MISLVSNNFGGGSVTLKDYQSSGLCVLNGKITVNPFKPAYIAATRLELDLPAGFAMTRSAISTAILYSNDYRYHYGTVLQCWIENGKLCIEKLTAWDTSTSYIIYINSAFVTRGYRGEFTKATTKAVTITSDPNLFRFQNYCYIEKDAFVYFVGTFNTFPEYDTHGEGPFTLNLSGFALDVNVEIPLIVNGYDIGYNQIGSKLTSGTFINGNLSFSYPYGASDMGGYSSFFNFFAVRG